MSQYVRLSLGCRWHVKCERCMALVMTDTRFRVELRAPTATRRKITEWDLKHRTQVAGGVNAHFVRVFSLVLPKQAKEGERSLSKGENKHNSSGERFGTFAFERGVEVQGL
ncbi:hypothetical protein BaRGS_00018671 [Batillaria attramentaria]|uniref:Uncharacterized protein n=1 Tax=Batillaria attramentaria TaxID=370345 RepID=A0ABD0KTB1_9CAEN